MLEHHTHLLAVLVDIDRRVGNINALKKNLPFRGMLEQVQRTQQRRFTGA